MPAGNFIDAAERRPLDTFSRWLLGAGVITGLSILYQIYFYPFDDGVLRGGGVQRLLLKVFFSMALAFSLRRYLTPSALTLNMLLKLPLLFLVVSVIVASPFTDSLSAQALNLLFFLPILLVDWNRPGGEGVFRFMWLVVAGVTVIQLALDPLLKVYFDVGWSNAALIGGMGNPNVFGAFLICAGIACAVYLRPRFRLLSTILFLCTPLTGSLASALIGFGCIFVQVFVLFLRRPGRTLLVGALVIVALTTFGAVLELATDSRAATHAFNKLMSVGELLSGGMGRSQSVSVRVEFTRVGLQLMADSPLSVLTGHPDGMPMWAGDGMWVQLLVSYGLPFTLAFLAANVAVMVRGFRSEQRDLRFSACIIGVIMLFFITNRIIDYWPVPLVYLLAFSYLTNRGIRRASPS